MELLSLCHPDHRNADKLTTPSFEPFGRPLGYSLRGQRQLRPSKCRIGGPGFRRPFRCSAGTAVYDSNAEKRVQSRIARFKYGATAGHGVRSPSPQWVCILRVLRSGAGAARLQLDYVHVPGTYYAEKHKSRAVPTSLSLLTPCEILRCRAKPPGSIAQPNFSSKRLRFCFVPQES